MEPQIDPLIALGVVVATATTDAAYVMFTASVVARRRMPAANWSAVWYTLSSFACLRGVRRGGLMDRGVPHDHLPAPHVAAAWALAPQRPSASDDLLAVGLRDVGPPISPILRQLICRSREGMSPSRGADLDVDPVVGGEALGRERSGDSEHGRGHRVERERAEVLDFEARGPKTLRVELLHLAERRTGRELEPMEPDGISH